MSNPAPTINQINAFNATQGTTIDFNIIGGTELVRSNRIYIYDLSDNSLICTHLYVSTESIHELPPNTDASMVYESGKSSADFVNGKQYYAQIQTFTDIGGTEGGSGLSVAKMFWCLVDPTLTITTIPSTISTTSYNVSATYDANTSVVSNIIQQYQFNLYNATGSLLQSSGVVVGNGEQQGTSTAYDISYNFTGLSVGSSYYVTIEVTTTQGMSVTTQSNAFTVSIDTPTLGEATVVNNACDGYISVTSNLSGEYGGSGSGEIVSFETDSENVFTKLQVDLEPVQDLHGYSKPWAGGAGKNKWNPFVMYKGYGYNKSQGTQITPDYVATIPTVTGNTITYAVNGWGDYAFRTPPLKAGDYRVSFTADNADARSSIYVVGSDNILKTGGYNHTGAGARSITRTLTQDGDYIAIYITSASTGTMVVTDYQIEQGTAVTSWTPYSNICPISGWDEVETVRTGKNLLSFPYTDTSKVVGGITYTDNGDGTITANGTATSTAYFDLIKVISPRKIKAGTYTYSVNGVGGRINVTIYKNGNWVNQGSATDGRPITFTTQEDTTYYAFLAIDSGVTVNNQKFYIQLELGTTATAYEPYDGQTITTTLPTTVYGGTLDVVNGTLTVDRAMVTLDGSSGENWSVGASSAHYRGYTYALSDIKPHSSNTQPTSAICDKIETGTWNDAFGGVLVLGQTGKAIGFGLDSLGITNYTDLNVWLSNNPITICYELATPTTYQLTPQQIQTLVGKNNVWSEQGEISLAYHIPITNLLVKRQDVADVSGNWLTLYSQPIEQASDMDFTFIDFLNQYGKTYKYALVPLLTQTQSGVEVEIEGGYTVSDNVDSIFDGVYIADQTNVERVKAGVGYGNIDMNQGVGSITPIGSKYPIVITNSQNQYHNGSVRGTIVPNDFYSNGNLSRIDMVNKRDELEQFLTNKRAKIIKDWNGKMWLVMIMSNVACSFDDNYGMGMVSFSADWLEVGDPTNQQDLYNAGLINVGGV